MSADGLSGACPPAASPEPCAGVSGLLEALAFLHAQARTAVLGIVYATAGSTYQKAGAMVLLDAGGMVHGEISGGCLEPEIEARARDVLARGCAQTVVFDTRSDEDLIFGSGTGCRGRVHLLLVPQAPGAPLTQALGRLTQARAPLALMVSTEGPATGGGQATVEGRTWSWGTGGHGMPWAASGNEVALIIRPPPRILLCGAGPETRALSLFARRLGWLLLLVEHRGRWLGFARGAGVREIIELPPGEAVPHWSDRHIDAALAMTHNYALDLKHLAICARRNISYIGLLGPAARRDALLAELGPSDTALLGERLHAPVGLALGGRGAGPVALAIAAELQQHFAAAARATQQRRRGQVIT